MASGLCTVACRLLEDRFEMRINDDITNAVFQQPKLEADAAINVFGIKASVHLKIGLTQFDLKLFGPLFGIPVLYASIHIYAALEVKTLFKNAKFGFRWLAYGRVPE